MSRLHELQCQFRDALLNEEINMIAPHIRNGALSVKARIGIYRNNVFTNLREALRTLYPVINQLVGEDFFNYAADEFIRRYPSPAGDLNQFGKHFAVFLTEFDPVAELIYLPDVAQLEWYAHQCYHAAAHSSLDLERLATIPPDMYDHLQFDFNPACRLMTSVYPVHRIWQVNQANYSGDPSVDLTDGGVHLLIQRHQDLIELQTLEAAEWTLLTELAARANFATASQKAMQLEPDLDLGRILAKFVMQSTLVDFQLVVPHKPTS